MIESRGRWTVGAVEANLVFARPKVRPHLPSRTRAGVPAFAGMTKDGARRSGPSPRPPAYAGVTSRGPG